MSHVYRFNSGNSRSMSEAELQNDCVLPMAKTFGWKVAHFRPGRTISGWVTPVSADGAGFPDLVMLREFRMVVVELKSQRNSLSPEQSEWMNSFKMCGAEVYLWRPSDWLDGTIESVLERDINP